MICSFIQSSVDGTQLRFVLRKGGPYPVTCLLIHGYGEASYVWRDACKSLAEVCTTVRVDLRGHGESEHSRSGRYDIAVYVADVIDLIASLGMTTPLIIIGHSLGARIAMHIAGRSRIGLLGLVIVDMCLELNAVGVRQLRSNLSESLGSYPTIGNYAAWLKRTRPMISATQAWRLAQGALHRVRDGYRLKLDPALLERSAIDTQYDDMIEVGKSLEAIICPTLLIRGVASALVSATAATRMARMLAQCKLEVIPRAGHAVMSDNPAAFNRAVRDFVEILAQRDLLADERAWDASTKATSK